MTTLADYREWRESPEPWVWHWPDSQYPARLRYSPALHGRIQLGDQTIDLDCMDWDQQVEAICDAVDVMVDSGHVSGFRYRDRILTNVEMNCFSVWRTQGTRSLFDAWAQHLLVWIGVSDGIDGTENNGTQSTAAGGSDYQGPG